MGLVFSAPVAQGWWHWAGDTGLVALGWWHWAGGSGHMDGSPWTLWEPCSPPPQWWERFHGELSECLRASGSVLQVGSLQHQCR